MFTISTYKDTLSDIFVPVILNGLITAKLFPDEIQSVDSQGFAVVAGIADYAAYAGKVRYSMAWLFLLEFLALEILLCALYFPHRTCGSYSTSHSFCSVEAPPGKDS